MVAALHAAVGPHGAAQVATLPLASPQTRGPTVYTHVDLRALNFLGCHADLCVPPALSNAPVSTASDEPLRSKNLKLMNPVVQSWASGVTFSDARAWWAWAIVGGESPIADLSPGGPSDQHDEGRGVCTC